MTVKISVVVPVFNGAGTLGACLEALHRQKLPSDQFEVIVVDDGSEDGSASIARMFDVCLVVNNHAGESAARNAGIWESKGKWVAFTDADCVPTRKWLDYLLRRVKQEELNGPVLGAAGQIIGFQSNSPAARYLDLTGGLNTQDHLNHPVFPYAPHGNTMYARDSLRAVGGIDERFSFYPGPDLHHRLTCRFDHPFFFVPHAVVLHQHRSSWRTYWRQQYGYGLGFAQFLLLYRDQFPWGLIRELHAWAKLVSYALQACVPVKGDQGLIHRGRLVQHFAQRLGFDRTYWNKEEKRKWNSSSALSAENNKS